jgi:hypothetical protein
VLSSNSDHYGRKVKSFRTALQPLIIFDEFIVMFDVFIDEVEVGLVYTITL